jgi:glycerophosphoryl diester phosphodiesterase
MARRKVVVLWGGALAMLGVYLANASWLARPVAPHRRWLAHRGVHQTFSRAGITDDTCTAARIEPPRHGYIENTIPAMRAAFDHGADVVELDEHPTADGGFAVFHDWTLDCRTDGKGVTREQTMTHLKSLDVGYGYTGDGGATFPLRGRGVGLMPSLAEVLDAFPGRRFLVNIKGNQAYEGEQLARFLLARPAGTLDRVAFYGAEGPMNRLRELVPNLRGFSRSSLKACFGRYLLYGWTGYVPAACRHTVFVLPASYGIYLWGWPHRFVARMASAGTDVFVVGATADGLSGIDSPRELEELGEPSDGGVWTDRIELLGPGER